MRRALPFAFALVASIACDEGGNSLVPPLNDGLPATCNPLRTPGACIMPWPDAIYLKADPTTVTGWRVALLPETLPVAHVSGTPIDTTRWNMADGFSPAASMLYYFAERIDPASLVPQDDIPASLKPGAATVIVDMASHALVAHFSGVDENVVHDTDRQGLLITPAQRLLPNHRYAVAITKSIRTLDGGLPTPPPLFQPMLQGAAPADAMSQAQLARTPAIVAALAAAGVPSTQLVVAWDFVTGSDEALTGHVLSMRDQALEAVGPDGAGYTVTSVENDFDAQTLRRIRGTFTVPQFIDNADESKPEALLHFDSSGNPVLLGAYQAPFTVIIPRAAVTKHPLPIILYGHGLFGTGENELGDATGSWAQDFANLEGYVMVATDWIGFSAHEDPVSPGNNDAFGEIPADFSKLPYSTDRLQQALVNAMVLARTMRGQIVNDPAMTVSGKAGDPPIADPTHLTYYGISLGGIMGMAFMGYDPDVLRGVLGCGGGFWGSMMPRSTDWRLADLLIPEQYPDPLDVDMLFQLWQMQADYADPATIAPYILKAPLRGVPKKQVLSQMGLNDAQVQNLLTEMIARTEGEPLMSPTVTTPYGLTPTQGPLPSAVTTWDIHGTPVPPDTNKTPGADNQVHEAIRRIPLAEQQIQTFFSTGQIVDTCGGTPCVEPVPPGTPDAGLP
ncbi:MAG TPA: hypothetical protein VF765_18270 [Polyangiaceae bacterium]